MVDTEDREITCPEDPKSDSNSLALKGGGCQNAPQKEGLPRRGWESPRKEIKIHKKLTWSSRGGITIAPRKMRVVFVEAIHVTLGGMFGKRVEIGTRRKHYVSLIPKRARSSLDRSNLRYPWGHDPPGERCLTSYGTYL